MTPPFIPLEEGEFIPSVILKANNKNQYLYNQELFRRARKLRNNSTPAEIFIWTEVLKSNKTGYAFKRQRPILNYIVDFVCLELLLIVEVDGLIHLDKEIQFEDKLRQQTLESAGFHIIRFTNEQVLKEISFVREIIMSRINSMTSES